LLTGNDGDGGTSIFRFWLIGGSLPITLAANWMAGTWDQNSAFYNVTPATALVELVSLRWLLKLFGLPAQSGGAFVPLGDDGQFQCIGCGAPCCASAHQAWNVEADGLFGAPPLP